MVKIKPRHFRREPRGWFSLFWAFGGVIAIIAAAALLMMTIVSVSQYMMADRFDTYGVTTSAEAISRRIRRNSDPDDSDDYFVTLQYEVSDATIVIERKVSRSFYRRATAGTSHVVRYLPTNPRKMEYFVGENRNNAKIFQIIAGISGVAALWGIWHYGRKANQAVLTRRYGYRTTATITAIVERKSSGKPTGKGYMVFRTADGLRGESLDDDINRLHGIGKGTDIIVYVRKGDVQWEGDVGPRHIPDSTVPKVAR